ncbi:MAG: hypothetical protein ABIA78_00905 [archaeon]
MKRRTFNKATALSLFFPSLMHSLLFSAYAEPPKDNFPLALERKVFDVTLAKEVGSEFSLGDSVVGKVIVHPRMDGKNYKLFFEASSSPLLLVGRFINQRNLKFEHSPNSKTPHYRSLETTIEDYKRVLIFPSKIKERHCYRSCDNGIDLEMSKKTGFEKIERKFNVPDDTVDAMVMLLNLLATDFSESVENYYLGRVKGNNNDQHSVEIFANVNKKGDDYSMRLDLPRDTLMEDETSCVIDYHKEEGKLEILLAALFVKKYLNSWAVATPIN